MDLLRLILNQTSSDLRAFSIKQKCNRVVFLDLESFLESLDNLCMSFVISMGEVQTSNVHTVVNHLAKLIDLPARRSIENPSK